MVKVDPTVGVRNPPRPKGDGFLSWAEEHVTAYEKCWPIGTRQRVWLDVLLYTGLRRGDAVRLGRQHIREGVATLKTEKTDTIVTLPILPVLAETLAAGPCGDLTFIAGESGTPLTKESFGNLFRDACRVAGVPGSAHGVRKIAATRAANAGATVAQLEAIFGWQGGSMAALYTRAADRRRLSIEAMSKLGNDKRTSIVAPLYEVRHLGEKKNEFSGKNSKWWAREDSNLQPSGYEPLALTIELRARHSFTTGRSRHRQHNIVDTFIKAARCKRGHPRDRRDHAFRRGDLLVFRRAVGLPAKQQLTRRIGEPVPFPWRARSGRPNLPS